MNYLIKEKDNLIGQKDRLINQLVKYKIFSRILAELLIEIIIYSNKTKWLHSIN